MSGLSASVIACVSCAVRSVLVVSCFAAGYVFTWLLVCVRVAWCVVCVVMTFLSQLDYSRRLPVHFILVRGGGRMITSPTAPSYPQHKTCRRNRQTLLSMAERGVI